LESVSFNYYHNELTDMLYARLKTDLPGPEVVRALEQCTDLRSIADEIHKKRIANSAMEKAHLQHVDYRMRLGQWLKDIRRALRRASSQKDPSKTLHCNKQQDQTNESAIPTMIDEIKEVRKHPMIVAIFLEKTKQYLDEAESHCHKFQSGDANIVELQMRKFEST
jgi:hypothetical protein